MEITNNDIYLIQTTDDAQQEQTFTLFDMNLKLTLYFNRVSTSWDMDLYNTASDEYIVQRKGLSLLAPALIENSLPFVVTLVGKGNRKTAPNSQVDLVDNFLVYFVAREVFFDLI